MLNTNSMIPESYLLAYEKYMQYKTGEPQCDIIHNRYIDAYDQEGYKERIAVEMYQKTDDVFGVKRNKRPDDETIIEYTNFILDRCENLVDWRIIATAKEKVNAPNNQKNVAAAIQEVMCGADAAQAYNNVAKAFGFRFSLLAYLFFVKDYQHYLPISPNNFDRCFKMIGNEYIDCPKLSRNGSWNVYCAFIQCVREIKQQLTKRYPEENITLLDTHSVLWVMGEKQFTNFFNNFEETLPRDIRAKETEVCAKARIGQGEYRKKMLELWNGKCSVTGCSFENALVASHAKPWKSCDAYECRDQYNGLILIPNLDSLFDVGYISFDDEGNILISTKVDINSLKILGLESTMRLRFIKQQNLPYLKYHRDNVFHK